MHSLLEKLLVKRGIKNVNELDTDEVQTFDGWNKILSEGEITIDKVGKFCQSQLDIIEGQLKDFDNTPQKNERLVIYFNVYKTLKDLISNPQAERSNLEKYLINLIK